MSVWNHLQHVAGSVSISAEKAGIPRTDPNSLLNASLSLVFSLVGIICVIVIIIAGFRYVVSQGDSGAVARAKNAILYAVVGLVISLMAFSIVRFVSAGVLGEAG